MIMDDEIKGSMKVSYRTWYDVMKVCDLEIGDDLWYMVNSVFTSDMISIVEIKHRLKYDCFVKKCKCDVLSVLTK